MMIHTRYFALLLFFLASCSAIVLANGPDGGQYANSNRTIQFDVKDLLNARAVTTYSDGKLITWNKGIDGNWSGLATRIAADLMGSRDKVAFPDDGIFAANSFHPKVQLNFSNNDKTGNQVRFTDRNVADLYTIEVPRNNYSTISLFFMSAFGNSEIDIEIMYSDGTSEKTHYTLGDWATRFPESAEKFLLSADLAKWGTDNKEMEKDSHFLTGINVQPKSNKEVVKVIISKPSSESTLTFWGATGYGADSPNWSIPANTELISYEGRVLNTKNGAVKLGYPGIITRAIFSGSKLTIHTKTSSNELYMDISVDGQKPVFMKVPAGENEIVLAEGLSAGKHTVTLYKRIESCVGVLEVTSFTVSGNFLEPSPLPVRKMMFMGDSFGVGQAADVEDGGPIDPSKAKRANARLSFGRLLADRFNAQCHIIGYAGKGIIRDWQGLTNVLCAPQYYEYTIPEDPTTLWDHKKYEPDVIGLCLGHNDFDIGIPEQVSYLSSFCEFLRKVRKDAPNAYIFLITAPGLEDAPGRIPALTIQKAYFDEIVRTFGDPKIKVIALPHFDGVPNDWHPSGTAHRKIADLMEPIIKQVMGW